MNKNTNDYFKKLNNNFENNQYDLIINLNDSFKILHTLEQFQLKHFLNSYDIDTNIIEGFNPLQELWDQATSGISKKANEFVNKVVGPIKNVGDNLKDEVENKLNDIVGKIKNELNNLINTVKKEIKETINIIMHEINKIVESTVKIINDIIKNIKIFLEKVISDIKNKMTTAFDNIIKDIENKVNSALNIVTTTISNAIDTINNTCNDEINNVLAKIKKETDKVETNLNTLLDNMKQFVEKHSSNIKNEVVDFINLIKNEFDNLKDIINDIINNLKKIAIDIYNNAMKVIEEAKQKFNELLKEANKAIIEIKNFAQSNLLKFIDITNEMFDKSPIFYLIKKYEDWSGYQAKGLIVFLGSNFIFINLFMFPWGSFPCKIAETMTIKNICFYVWGAITLFYFYIVYFVLFKKDRIIRTTPLHVRIFNKLVVKNCDKIKDFTFISCTMWVNILYILTVWGLSRKFISNPQIIYSITGLSSIVIALRRYIF